MEGSVFNPSFRAEQSRIRNQLPPERYLGDIRKYFHDAVGLCIAQDVRKPLNFMASYFDTVLSGENVLFRNFKYVNSTARNRRSFIRVFNQTFGHFEDLKGPEAIGPESFHQLLCLLCADFPFSLVRNASRITLDSPTQIVSFKELSTKMFILFFYSEFMNQVDFFFA